MNEPKDETIVNPTAEALTELAELLEKHEPSSPAIQSFVAQHAALPEFRELSDEALRIQVACGSEKHDASLPREPVATARQQALSWLAGFAGLAVFFLIVGSGILFAIRAQTLRGEVTELHATLKTNSVQYGQLDKQYEELKLVSKDAVRLAQQNKDLQQQIERLELAAAKDIENEREVVKGYGQCVEIRQKGKHKLPEILQNLRECETNVARGFEDKIPMLVQWSLHDPDQDVARGAVDLIFKTYDTTRKEQAWNALNTITRDSKHAETRFQAQEMLYNALPPTFAKPAPK